MNQDDMLQGSHGYDSSMSRSIHTNDKTDNKNGSRVMKPFTNSEPEKQ